MKPDRQEAHRRLDELLDRIEALDARNDDVGRFEEAGRIVAAFRELAEFVGVGALVRQRFNGEALEALGAERSKVDDRANGDRMRPFPHMNLENLEAARVSKPTLGERRAAFQWGAARAVLDWLSPLLPDGAGKLLATAVVNLPRGHDAGVLTPAVAFERQKARPDVIQHGRRRMEAKAWLETAADGARGWKARAVAALATGAEVSDETAKNWMHKLAEGQGVVGPETPSVRELVEALLRCRGAGLATPPGLDWVESAETTPWAKLREVLREFGEKRTPNPQARPDRRKSRPGRKG